MKNNINNIFLEEKLESIIEAQEKRRAEIIAFHNAIADEIYKNDLYINQLKNLLAETKANREK